MDSAQSRFKSGALAAATAYFCWGLWPIFWKQLETLDALELIAHRIAWSELTIVAILVFAGPVAFWRGIERKVVLRLGASACLLFLNWWVYVWAVNSGRIVESSLGYFINPLVSVLLGVVLLKERLNHAQWFAVGIAASGVAFLTFAMGSPPWIAIALALTFGGYGLIRKVTVVDSQRGLAIEGAWLFLPAMFYLVALHVDGRGHFGESSARVNVLLACTGPISAVPLLLFAYGARRIPLSLIGILQYIGPTLQFLTGVFLYNEPFSRIQLIGYGLTWTALVIYAADSARRFVKERT